MNASMSVKRASILRAAATLALLLGAGQAAAAHGHGHRSSRAAPPGPGAGPGASSGVPGLHVVWDCGACEHNDKVPPLIEQAYAEAAEKGGRAVSRSDVAEAAIVDFRQRKPGARVMLGIMAGRDRLGLRIRYRGQGYSVADSSGNAIMGLNYLSGSVGKRAYASLASVAGVR